MPITIPTVAYDGTTPDPVEWANDSVKPAIAEATGTHRPQTVLVTTGLEARPAGSDVVIWVDPDELGTPNALATDPVIVPGGGGGGTTGSVDFEVTNTGDTVVLSGDSFVTYPLASTPVTNVGGGSWNSTTFIYTVPEDGLYLCLAGVRLADGDAVRNLAVGVGITNADAPFVHWQDTGGARGGRQYTRRARFVMGDQVRLYIYSAGAPFATKNGGDGQYLSVTKLAD